MQRTYQNPVWPAYFADPFVLRWGDTYYAYGTSSQVDEAGRVFPVLRSPDLVQWEHVGGALEVVAPSRGQYWAPEVAERNGTFYMYYSTAGDTGDETHRLRVAIADHPAGPFRDTGKLVAPNEGFTIDAHPFRDPRDGRWYLFFAKDFFDERVGTGIAVAPLASDMCGIVGQPATVVRASADWQIYERDRDIYGQNWAAWHTVEGPFVLYHEGRYYCLYSGGAWQTPGYGVSFAVADTVMGPYRDLGSQEGPAVLRGIPDQVIGPGHNSVVLGPDQRTNFVVYHAWDTAHTARRMCIDPLEWTESGPRCVGPSVEPQVLEL